MLEEYELLNDELEKRNEELNKEIKRLNNDIKVLLKENENKVSYLEILVYRLNNLISYLLENSDEATSLYEDYKAKKIDKDIKKELERLRESEEYHRKGYAELHKRIE